MMTWNKINKNDDSKDTNNDDSNNNVDMTTHNDNNHTTTHSCSMRLRPPQHTHHPPCSTALHEIVAAGRVGEHSVGVYNGVS